MSTLAEFTAQLASRCVTIVGPTLASKETSMIPVYRYAGVKNVDGVDKEIFVDVSVFNQDTPEEYVVERDVNKEPVIDPLKDELISWFAGIADNSTTPGRLGHPEILVFKPVRIDTGNDVSNPNATLKAWVLDAGEVRERNVFIYRVGQNAPIWHYMKDV